MLLAQAVMILTLLLMVTGRTPIYLTAITGSFLAAVAAGFPLAGKADVTIQKLVNGGLNSVIANMTGVLMLIGIIQAAGFLDVIIKKIMEVGSKLGGAPSITAAGSLVAGSSAVWQYYLTGGPVAALSTAVAVVPGVELKKANAFRHPAMVFGFPVLCCCVNVVNMLT